MKRPARYNTKQRDAILAYIISLHDGHVTAAQIEKHFEDEAISISRTTIYRHLDRLTESGKLRKYIIDGQTGACYQYIDHARDCVSHFHLKCEDCGQLLHLRCDTLSEVQRHMFSAHTFRVNSMKTVLYGTCKACLQRSG